MDTFLNSPIAPHVSSKMVNLYHMLSRKKWYFYLLELGFGPNIRSMDHGTISFVVLMLQWLLVMLSLLVVVLQSPVNMVWMLSHWKPFNRWPTSSVNGSFQIRILIGQCLWLVDGSFAAFFIIDKAFNCLFAKILSFRPLPFIRNRFWKKLK